MVAPRVFVSLLLRWEGLAADRAPELGDAALGRHCHYYAYMLFIGFKARAYK
jgi:hypothetical protein